MIGRTIAEEYGFFNMKSNKNVKYAVPSGDCISQNDVLKIIEIQEDMSWRLIISGHEVDPNIIGLQNVLCKTKVEVRILFNTVKQACICRGKKLENDQRSSQYRVVQEWNVCDETTIETRISSRKCHKVLSFTAISEVCPICSATRDYVQGEQTEAMSDEEMFNKLFPDASESMMNHLRDQSKRCKYNKDPRGHRWDKETIRIALSL